MKQNNSSNKTLVIGVTASHSTKLVNGQVAGYPAKAGIQLNIKASAQPTKNTDVPLRGVILINWIPAFAGMTELMGSQL